MKSYCLILLFLSAWGSGYAENSVPAYPHIKVETTEGTFVLELANKRAPLTVQNFLSLIDSGYFDGTIFHRVIPHFMIQGGGLTPDLKEKKSGYTILNESGNGLSNTYGTIAMARQSDPHTASTQFFINVANNTRLDPSPTNWGYAVFGYVIEGMKVIDKIVLLPTGPSGRFKNDVPIVPIVIKKISRVIHDD
jgi:peptidyl-prolyl cis-trans isomerase A (cyclophilin A)